MMTLTAGLVILGLAGRALAEAGGGQRFLLIFRDPEAAPVGIAAGPIGGIGTTIRQPIVWTLHSILFRSQMTTNTFASGFESCTATANQSGTWQITGGTGAVAGATGEDTPVGRVVGVRGDHRPKYDRQDRQQPDEKAVRLLVQVP